MARLWHKSYCAIWWVSVTLASLLDVLPVTFFVFAWSIYQFLRAGWFGVRTPGEAKWFSLLHTRPDRPCGPNSPVNNGNRSSGWGVALTTPPLSIPEVKNDYVCTCIPFSVPTCMIWGDICLSQLPLLSICRSDLNTTFVVGIRHFPVANLHQYFSYPEPLF